MKNNSIFSIVKQSLLILFLSPLFLLTSCEVDPCEGVVCGNGFCQDGSCICLDGYTGQFCQIAPVQDPCIVNNTGEIQFSNNSTTGKIYDILLDGVRMTTLSPGQTSPYYTATAGWHELQFRVANSNSHACTTTNIDIIKCNRRSLSCSG